VTPERWHRVQLLVEQALEQPQGARRAFVTSACSDDIDLRDEVVSLLSACERSPETLAPPTAWFDLLTRTEIPRFSVGDKVAQRYRVGRLLGRGGMGEVYEAWDDELSIPVALKTLHLPGGTEEAHKSLKLEGLLARSVWHPNVCRLYDLGRHGEGDHATWFLTMELLRGETLAMELQERGRLPLDRARRFAEQMAAGLGAAHRAGVVHRDFKTANTIIVDRDGSEHAVVTDFGIARAASQRASDDHQRQDSGPIVGTPAYMAPEQVRGEEVGPAADIYALGIVLYEMVTGAVPFSGDSPIAVARRRLEEDPPSPRSFLPDLADRWEAVILRCLAREPRRRFGRAEEVAEALGEGSHVEKIDSLDLAARTPQTLPSERDLFVGRQMESEELARSLAGRSPLVTLVGPGGMGKTRLAVHYGWSRLGELPGGVWFCDLTEARSLEGVVSAVAGSLGVQLGRGDPVEQLGHAIAGRGRCLMILDNFEQAVVHAAATVGRWVARAGEARFLVTSREKLNLGAQETVLAVGPLSIEVGVELFAARARRLRPGLELGGSEAESVREIVRLVDGMPLAIELAGARMRVMTAAQILAQMRKRFSLLTGGASARHETLAIAIDGSWELLKPWEQSAWAQCSVFEGGFTLEAAEGVIDLDEWPEAPWVVDVVQSLVDKSLLRTWAPAVGTGEGVPEARFGMFVSLQEYARMKLREHPSLAAVRREVSVERATELRHGRWYARYGTPEVIKKLKHQRGLGQVRRIGRDLDNLVAASWRAVSSGDAGIAVATYSASWAVLDLRGPFGVAVELGREVLRGLPLGRTEEAHVFRTLGQAEWYSGMVEESHAHLEAALAIAREVCDRQLEGIVLGDLGGMQVTQGRMDEGSVYLEMALELARAVGDRHLECNTLNTLSVTRRGQGRSGEARAYAELALEVARIVGDRNSEGNILSNLGLVLQDQGSTEAARAYYEEALAIHRDVGHRRMEGNTHSNLGGLYCDLGRMDEARSHLEAALVIHRETGSRFSEGISLINLGFLYHTQGQLEAARTHLEGALAIEQELGNRRLEGNIIATLGRLHQDRGEMEAARNHYESALAIHREVSDRRSEGSTLAYMANLLYSQGSIDAAREALATGEQLLREVDAPLELGQLLCIRAELEHAAGGRAFALATLNETEALALRMGSGPDSELGRMIAKLRRILAARA
jgi:serine/threonine protein kinase/predicted ATPase/tetratricopeptide (TPR) repeat protein